MSFFHKLYLGNDCDFNELKKACLEYMPKSKSKVTESDNQLSISSEAFTIFLKEGGNSVKFRSEDYNLNLNYDFYIDTRKYNL